MKIAFEHITLEWDQEKRQYVATFADGSICSAWAHDTDAYRAHALEKSTGDIDLYCWQHEIAHQIAAMMLGRSHSVVLWNLAHAMPVDGPQCVDEEQLAQEFQKAFFLR